MDPGPQRLLARACQDKPADRGRENEHREWLRVGRAEKAAFRNRFVDRSQREDRACCGDQPSLRRPAPLPGASRERARAMPAFPLRRISQSGPQTWRPCGSFTLGRSTDSISSEIRTSRARMSAGNWDSSASTVSLSVSTAHAIGAHHARFGIARLILASGLSWAT